MLFTHLQSLFFIRRIARENRIASINTVIFPIFIFWHVKKNKWTTEPYQFFPFLNLTAVVHLMTIFLLIRN